MDDFSIRGLYHGVMKADLRISIKDFQRSKTSKFSLLTGGQDMLVPQQIRRTVFLTGILPVPVLIDRIGHFDQPRAVIDQFQQF